MEWRHHKKMDKRFFKLASVKSVKTACLCLYYFLFSLFQIWSKYFFNNNGALLIAKVEITLYLKHEIILYQKEKGSKIFQVKTISKDVRKTIVPSFMFLFNLSKSIVLCIEKM